MASKLFLAALAVSLAPAFGQPAIPTIYVIGDSTASYANHRGWADPFADYFDPAKTAVVNRARAGRSSRTFFTEGLWERVRNDLKPGDYLLIQFGHNDGGAPDKPPYRGSLPGLGEETRDVVNPNGSPETVHSFGWYMRQFINGAKEKGANPIVLSLTVRNIWTGASVERGSGNFSKWSAEIAKAENLPFADITNATADLYERMGEAEVQPLFPEDHTHTSPAGADLNASLVVACLKGLHSPLAAWLSAKGESVTPYP